MATKTPVAFLLTKFKESNDEPISKAAAESLFTAVGRGTMNVVDWFDDNTHGSVDMSGNTVYGWLELAETLDAYQTKLSNGTFHRAAIIDLGRAAAVAAGIDLSKFRVVVVVTNLPLDLFGGTGYVCCTAATTGLQFWEVQAAPSVLCQEIIHGLGIYEHSRRHGSDDDYQDPYDVMSMFAAQPGRHPNNPNMPVGPGLNAAFMNRCGWLDTSRAAPLGQVTLRPLHRRDLRGPLYCLIDKYYVEYRPSARWDTGFASVVLVHYLENNTSYLVAELRAGMEFTWGNSLSTYDAYGSIKVDAIDDASETATITSVFRPAAPVPILGPITFFGRGVLVDAGGWGILNGKIIRIPPRSPEYALLEAAVTLASVEDIEIAANIKTEIRAKTYARILGEIGEVHEHITEPKSPFDELSKKEVHRFHALLGNNVELTKSKLN